MTQTPPHTPALRFPEFRGAGAWEVKRIEDLLKIGNGKSYKGLLKGNIPVYGTGGYMLSVNDYLYDGESVCIGRKGTIDKPFFLSGKFWTVDTLFYTHSFKDCLPKFIYLCFQNINWTKHNQATGVPSLSRVIIDKIKILIPEITEQEKIAGCLLSLDEVITAHGDKLDGLKDYKRGLMQQLFPAKGETTPTLRFPEFQDKDPWQATKLGEAFKLYQPQTLSRSQLKDSGQYNVYGANGIIGRHDKYNHENSEVIIACRGTCGEVHYTEPKVWITGNAMVVNPKNDNLSKIFILYYLKNHGLKAVISGSAQPQITREGLAPLPIVLPPLAEQQKIADCLSAMDGLITAQADKIETLKTYKKGLMQQLFPKL